MKRIPSVILMGGFLFCVGLFAQEGIDPEVDLILDTDAEALLQKIVTSGEASEFDKIVDEYSREVEKFNSSSFYAKLIQSTIAELKKYDSSKDPKIKEKNDADTAAAKQAGAGESANKTPDLEGKIASSKAQLATIGSTEIEGGLGMMSAGMVQCPVTMRFYPEKSVSRLKAVGYTPEQLTALAIPPDKLYTAADSTKILTLLADIKRYEEELARNKKQALDQTSSQEKAKALAQAGLKAGITAFTEERQKKFKTAIDNLQRAKLSDYEESLNLATSALEQIKEEDFQKAIDLIDRSKVAWHKLLKRDLALKSGATVALRKGKELLQSQNIPELQKMTTYARKLSFGQSAGLLSLKELQTEIVKLESESKVLIAEFKKKEKVRTGLIKQANTDRKSKKWPAIIAVDLELLKGFPEEAEMVKVQEEAKGAIQKTDALMAEVKEKLSRRKREEAKPLLAQVKELYPTHPELAQWTTEAEKPPTFSDHFQDYWESHGTMTLIGGAGLGGVGLLLGGVFFVMRRKRKSEAPI